MAIIRHTNFDTTVANIQERNSIKNKIDHMTVLVMDAISDVSAGAGKATYRWSGDTNEWVLISKSSTETISFATEELSIVNGKVLPSNFILDNQIWNVDVVNNSVIVAQPRMENLTITYQGISGLSLWDGMKLRFTYAYGSTNAQLNSVIKDLENKIDNFSAGLPTKTDLDSMKLDAGTVNGYTIGSNVPANLQGLLDSKLETSYLSNVTQDILPSASGLINIGSETKRFKGIYVNEAYLSTNTLYVGGVPVLGTDAENIVVKADMDQSITVKTIGLGITNITSENEVAITTVGTNADVKIQATGNNSKVKFSGAGGIEFSNASTFQNDLAVLGNLTLSGTVVANGGSFLINATTVTTKDNIIVLNQGEVGSGVTAGKSGFQVDRGDLADFQFIFDEADDKFKVGVVGGTFETMATREYVTSALSSVNVDLSGYYTKVEFGTIADFTSALA